MEPILIYQTAAYCIYVHFGQKVIAINIIVIKTKCANA